MRSDRPTAIARLGASFVIPQLETYDVELNGTSGAPATRENNLLRPVPLRCAPRSRRKCSRRPDQSRLSLFCYAVSDRPGVCAGRGDGGFVGPWFRIIQASAVDGPSGNARQETQGVSLS